MYIKNYVETEEGTVEFQGELTGEEAAFVLEVGMNWLLANGAKFKEQHTEEDTIN